LSVSFQFKVPTERGSSRTIRTYFHVSKPYSVCTETNAFVYILQLQHCKSLTWLSGT